MGTLHSAQCNDPLDPGYALERQFFESVWLRIVESQAKQENSHIT